MLALRIGWRSFVRHRRRSAITLSAIALGLAMMLFFVGMGTDSHAKMADMGIRLGSGHVLVEAKDYPSEQSPEASFTRYEEVVRRAESLEEARVAAPRLSASGLVTAGAKSTSVFVVGVDPTREPRASSIAAPEARVAGSFLTPSANRRFENAPGDAYLGNSLATHLGVEVGDRIVITVSPVDADNPKSAAFQVVGLFETGIEDLDRSQVQIDLTDAQKLLNVEGSVTQVAVLLGDLDATDGVTAALARELVSRNELVVLPWPAVLKELHDAIVLDDVGMYLMMAIIFVIVALGIFNTVLMSVTERTREIGVMMAIGTSRWRVFSSVLAESAVLAIASTIVGLALGLAGHLAMAHYGIDVTSFTGGQDYEISGVVLRGRIYSRLSFDVVAEWTLVVIGLVIASAIYPAYRAARLEPVEAMRHV